MKIRIDSNPQKIGRAEGFLASAHPVITQSRSSQRRVVQEAYPPKL